MYEILNLVWNNNCFSLDFQLKVLMKLESLLENQADILALQRRMLSNMTTSISPDHVDDMDVELERPC